MLCVCVCRWVKPDEGGFKRPPRSPDSGLARQAMSAGDETNSLRSARDDSGRRDDSSSAPGVPLTGVASLEAASSFLSVASERSCESDDNQSPATFSIDSADESGGANERATGHSGDNDNDNDDALSSSDDDLYYGDSDSEDESFNPDDWNDSVHMMHDDGEGRLFFSVLFRQQLNTQHTLFPCQQALIFVNIRLAAHCSNHVVAAGDRNYWWHCSNAIAVHIFEKNRNEKTIIF